MKPFHRYILFQIPGWMTVAAVMGFLHVSAGVSAGAGVGVVALMMALDFVLYPFFRHSYAARAWTGVESLAGERARVVKTLDPAGMLRIRGELWKARLLEPDRAAQEGETVEVAGIEGLTLLVRRVRT